MLKKSNVPVITIDGPSGTGKGTICHLLAAHLGWHFLDSGALYRLLALSAKKKSIEFSDVNELVKESSSLDLRFAMEENNRSLIYLNGEEVSEAIRDEHCGQNASKIAVIPEVRQALLERQRAFATPPGLVTDGRDMGTVVFPQAILKIYLYASVEERASRRYLQLKQSGNSVRLAQVVDELKQRDQRDTEREHSPMKPAEDAVLIDTTGQTIDQVFTNVVQLTNESWFKK